MPLNIAEQSDLAALQAQLDDHEARLTALEGSPPPPPGNTAPAVTQQPVVGVQQDSGPFLIDLHDVFQDAEDPDLALVYTVEGNTDPMLVATSIGAGVLTLAFTAGQTGMASVTVRATDTGGLFAEVTIPVTVSATPPPPGNNIDTIRAAGHPCPPVDQWWIAEPPPAQIKAAIIAPLPGAPRRMWIPRTMDATTLDLGIVNGGGAYSGFNTMSPLYPQQSALYSHLLRAQGDDAGADQQMQAAVANYFASPYSGQVYAGYSTKALWSRLLCMDWVDFGGQYEAAFELMKTELEAELAGPGADRDWRVDGYWNATHARYSGWVLRTMLALAAYNVNPSGASHAWAESWIDKIGAPVSPSADEAAWSPWAAANVEQLLSRRGGGTEYGHGSTNVAGFGSYEEEFALGVLAVMWAVDTLTDSALMDVRSNLYLTTRHLGLVAERDGDTGYSYAGKACIMAFGKLLRDTDPAAAGAYRWLASGFGNATSGWRELLACAGPDPAEQSPAGVISDRLGSAWHYRADAGDIASLRARHTCHDLEHFRFSPEVGAFDFRFGGVGLTDARVNRGGINGCQSNGFWFGNHCPDGVNPRHISDSQGWGQECTIRKHLLNHAFGPDAVLNDPFYIMGDASGPELQPDGTWQWSVDISTLVGGRPQELVEAGYEVTGPCSIALLFDPGHQRLELTHVLSVSSPYLGWHFAPTHAPVFETGLPAGQDRFTVSDGTDTVRVAIESLDGIGWDRVEKTEHISPTGGAFRLDYHQRATPVVSVAYTPQQRQATHTVKLTMEVV